MGRNTSPHMTCLHDASAKDSFTADAVFCVTVPCGAVRRRATVSQSIARHNTAPRGTACRRNHARDALPYSLHCIAARPASHGTASGVNDV